MGRTRTISMTLIRKMKPEMLSDLLWALTPGDWIKSGHHICWFSLYTAGSIMKFKLKYLTSLWKFSDQSFLLWRLRLWWPAHSTFPVFLALPLPVNELQAYWIHSIFSAPQLLPIFLLSLTYFFFQRALPNVSKSVKVDPSLCSVDFVLIPRLAPFCNCLFFYPYIRLKLLRDSDFLT